VTTKVWLRIQSNSCSMLCSTRLHCVRTLPVPCRGMRKIAAWLADYRKKKALGGPQDWKLQYQEKFIPFSKRDLVRMLTEFFYVLPDNRMAFLSFVEQADTSLLRQYHSTLEELKSLYDPLNPDRDTFPEISLTEVERSSLETRLLNSMADVVKQANFNVMSEDTIAYALLQDHPQDRLQVRVNLESYEYMKFWALGERLGPLPSHIISRSRAAWNLFGKIPPSQRRYFKRVLVVARMKGSHMILKSFKDIPLEALEFLLPEVQVRTSLFAKTFLYTTLAIGGVAIFINVGMVMLAEIKIGGFLFISLFGGFMAYRSWRAITQHRNARLLELSNTLYYRSTSNNMELLVALVERAREEHAKEIILVYAFLQALHNMDEVQPILTVEDLGKIWGFHRIFL
uniref:Transmembrane protein 143 n=1 Tax=Latimeria chalumnae TaxID=7897 RepID=H2ZXK0_LATCH